MKEYLKNKNEYKEDGKLYVEEIQKCTCSIIEDGQYVLSCKIIQRGEHLYSFEKESGKISKPYSLKSLHLSENALKKVMEAVDRMDEKIAEALSGSYKIIKIDPLKSALYYKNIEDFLYDVMIQTEKPDKSQTIKVFESVTAGDMVHKIFSTTIFRHDIDEDIADIIFRSDKDQLMRNPLYIGAIENEDELLQKQLRVYYGIDSREDCRSLEEVTGKRILPSLPEEYDKDFGIDAETIDIQLLKDSGYNILHRPNFAMMGSTRKKWTLNPHTKSGVDAAKKNEEAITFSEYLELFGSQQG